MIFPLDAKFSCSSFPDIGTDLAHFAHVKLFTTLDNHEIIRKEASTLLITFLLFGHLLNEYPDNYAFELRSRLTTLYCINSNLTNLLKQCDEQSPRHCALIVPYSQLQPPGNGLFLSVNKHTLPVVDLDFTKNKEKVISLSNKINVIYLSTLETQVDIKLPELDEPYLNSTTLPKMIIHFTKQDINIKSDDNETLSDSDDDAGSSSSDAENSDAFKHYAFLVNSFHHVYLISSYGEIKFQQTSQKGFLTVDVISKEYGLCILAEKNSNSVQCWNLGQNILYAKIDLSTNVSIKTVLWSKIDCFMIIVILFDGTILFYTLNDSKFIHRGTINGGKHLHLVIADKDKLICTFDATIPVDLAYIDFKPLRKTQQILSDKDIVKVLIAFNPPITPKPIQRIILPDGNKDSICGSMKIFFIIVTKECLYIVHTCKEKDISYVRISGQFDVIAAHVKNSNIVFTARCGIIDIFRWKCIKGKKDKNDKCDIYHEYELYVSIDISSSPVLTIKPMSNDGKNIL